MQQIQAEQVGTEIYPTSSHSSWPLDTVPEEELGKLSPFQEFLKTPMSVCMN